MFQFQSFKATENFKIAATGNGGLLEQEKKQKKEKKEMLLERAEIPAGCGMYLRGAGCSTQRQSPDGLNVG